MKKILAFILAAAMFICVFASCAKDEDLDTIGGYDYSAGGYDASHDPITPHDEWYKEYIDGYLKHTEDFYNTTMGFLENNAELSHDEFLNAWSNRNGAWWRTIYSSTLSFKDTYTMITPPTAADRVYRDQIFEQGDANISSAVLALQVRLGFDPTSAIDDPGYKPWDPEYYG